MKDPKDVTLLVVDDEEALRNAIAFDFERKGFNTLKASNGLDAFELVGKQRPDLVITDVRMPGGDGVELLERIKNLNPEIPVVMFITGFSDLSQEEAFDRGADAVFAKPFNRKMLFNAVMRALSSQGERWARKFERFDVSFEIQLKFPSLRSAIDARVLNVGRGGMFVELKKELPKVDDTIEFHVELQNGEVTSFSGVGIVRWVRTELSDELPAGCGIEFIEIHDDQSQRLVNYIGSLRAKPFIPRS